ncbi:MAG: hypothetical protein IPJ74_09945 [Saprospiraceae bacterium]|nr:hypothetical protein [Saprospiraceae bacterium]
MEELKALIGFISKNKVKQIDVIGNPKNRRSQSQKLYEKIADKEIEDDNQIIEHFFRESDNAQFYSSRLKKKLKNRLINTLFFIDINQPNLSEYNKAYYTAYKQSAAVKILLANFARKAAIPLAEKLLKNAIQFDITDVVFSTAQVLSRHYATIDGDLKKFEEYDLMSKKYLDILQAENIASSYYNHLRVHFTKAQGYRPGAVEDAKRYSDELRVITQNPEITSYTLNYLAYLVHSIRYEIANEYSKLLGICQEALSYFETKKEIVPENVSFSFMLRKFICYTQLKMYKEAWQTIPEFLKLTDQGSSNWFLALEYSMILSLHTVRFQDAYDCYIDARNNSEYDKLPKNLSERWKIYEAYIYYFISIKKIPDERNPLKKFRISKFVNDVPMYSKDKQGINISILILQVLFLLHEQRYNEIIDKTESLKTYTHRYLRRDDTFRSHCFIRMLLTLPDGSFHKKAVLRKAEPFWKKLQSKPIQVANQIAEVEPVPYEMLWSFVLESLDEQWH